MGVLRLLLALSVVLVHTGSLMGLEFVGGVVAVETFFMISGFYMALILHEKYVGAGSFGLFITNRFLRIFPVYWVVLAVALMASLMAALLRAGGVIETFLLHAHELGLPFIFISMVSNLFLFGQDWLLLLDIDSHGAFSLAQRLDVQSPAAHEFLLIPQAWSLGIELTFYLIAPLFLRLKSLSILLIIFAILGARVFLYQELDLWRDPWSYRFFPLELGFFLMGWLSYKIYVHLLKMSLGKLPLIATATILGLTIFFQALPDIGVYAGMHVKAWCYYIVFFLLLPFVFIHTKSNHADRYIGELSYPVYVCHVLVLQVFSFLGFGNSAFVIVGSLLMAWALYSYVAVPVERIRMRRLGMGGG